MTTTIEYIPQRSQCKLFMCEKVPNFCHISVIKCSGPKRNNNKILLGSLQTKAAPTGQRPALIAKFTFQCFSVCLLQRVVQLDVCGVHFTTTLRNLKTGLGKIDVSINAGWEGGGGRDIQCKKIWPSVAQPTDVLYLLRSFSSADYSTTAWPGCKCVYIHKMDLMNVKINYCRTPDLTR